MTLAQDIRHAASAGSTAVSDGLDAVLEGDYNGFTAAVDRFTGSAAVQRIASRISAVKADFDAFTDKVTNRLAEMGIDRQLVRMFVMALAGGLLLTSTDFIAKIVGLLLLLKLMSEIYTRRAVLIEKLDGILARFRDEVLSVF